MSRAPVQLFYRELCAFCVGMVVIFLLGLSLQGCRSIPEGYDRDTTPGHDGADWIGGTK
jgi:hypothetical protein